MAYRTAGVRDMILADLRRDEGLRLKAYTDTVGKITIGYGRNLSDIGVSTEEAERMLAVDEAQAENSVEQWLAWSSALDDNRFAVLVEMVYNMGLAAVLTFHNSLDAVRTQRWEDAAKGFRASLADKQEPLRMERWAKIIETGEVPT